MPIAVSFDRSRLSDFCRRWKIAELAFFGSVLRSDFSPESDIDVLAEFGPTADWGLWDHAQMQEELSEILGRKVDFVTRNAVEGSENWIRRDAILNSLETVYVAG